MTPVEALLVVAAGAAGGAVNAVAGGGTLLTFPALLAVGLGPVTAVVTSAVGLLPGYAAGSIAYRRELAGQGRLLRRLAVPAALGAGLGAVLLLTTPQGAFRAVVPWLVLASCGLLGVQPRLSRALQRGHSGAVGAAVGPRDRTAAGAPADPAGGLPRPPLLLHAGVGAAAVYGTFFGAGLGVVLLAVLGLALAGDLQRLNALKGALSLGVSALGVLVFLGSGDVVRAYAGLLAIGSVVGGTAGVALARQLPGEAVRRGVVAVGIVVALVLLLR